MNEVKEVVGSNTLNVLFFCHYFTMSKWQDLTDEDMEWEESTVSNDEGPSDEESYVSCDEGEETTPNELDSPRRILLVIVPTSNSDSISPEQLLEMVQALKRRSDLTQSTTSLPHGCPPNQ